MQFQANYYFEEIFIELASMEKWPQIKPCHEEIPAAAAAAAGASDEAIFDPPALHVGLETFL